MLPPLEGPWNDATYHDNWMKVQMKRKGFRLKILPAKKASPPNSAPNLWNSLWGWITIGFVLLGIKEILGSTLCTRIFLLFLLAVFNFAGVLWWTKIVIFGWKFFSKEHSPEFWSPDSYFWLPFTTRLFIQLDQGNFWRIVIWSWRFMVNRILDNLRYSWIEDYDFSVDKFLIYYYFH